MAAVDEYLQVLYSDTIDLNLDWEEREKAAKEMTGFSGHVKPDDLYYWFFKKYNREFERYFTLRILLANIYLDSREPSTSDSPEKSYTSKASNMAKAKEVEAELKSLEEKLFLGQEKGAVNVLSAGKIIAAAGTALDHLASMENDEKNKQP